jgi:type I restriction-modification system DNA methylase subunit
MSEEQRRQLQQQPFSAHWSASQLFMSDDRFSVYGKLAPSSKADLAFVQHMIYQLAEDGWGASQFGDE